MSIQKCGIGVRMFDIYIERGKVHSAGGYCWVRPEVNLRDVCNTTHRVATPLGNCYV